MDTHKGGSLGRHRFGKVAWMGAVGRAHFHQARPTLAQHIGNAKTAANLHQLATADHHLASQAERSQN